MKPLLPILLLLISSCINADNFFVTDSQGDEIAVRHYPSEGNLLIIWLVDHEEERSMFEKLLSSVNGSGAELWRVDLLDAYFLPRSSESTISLSGTGVAALLKAAHEKTSKRVLLVAYDRMAVPLLRGARLWQQDATNSRLTGAILFYPNLFELAPVAGEKPVVDPVVKATNIPVVIYQPDMGAQRWRLDQAMEALWRGGAPAFAYIVPRVRDWFFMGEFDHGPGDKEATSAIPGQIAAFVKLMENYPKPDSVTGSVDIKPSEVRIMELVALDGSMQSPGFSLPALTGNHQEWSDYSGRVTLVNFWATWCPPCVEEIPSLNRLVAQFKEQDFAVVSIDYRETRQELLDFTQQIPVDFPVLFDVDGKASLLWNVFSFPSSYLVDKQGRIRYSANRAIDWDTQEIRSLVNRLIAE